MLGLEKYFDIKPACETARKELLNCLLQSECVKNCGTCDRCPSSWRDMGFTPRECLEGKLVEAPPACVFYRKKLYDCKRSQIDPRTRFRGKSDDFEK